MVRRARARNEKEWREAADAEEVLEGTLRFEGGRNVTKGLFEKS